MTSKSAIIASLVIIGVVFGGIGGYLIMTNPFEPSRVAVVIMDPGFNDWGFADNIRLGMDEVGYEVAVQYYIPEVLPTTVAEARTLVTELSQSNQYKLILILGNELAGVCSDAAASYPNQKYGMIGAEISASNVMSSTFATEEGAYLAGVLAVAEISAPEYQNHSYFGNMHTIGILSAVSGDYTLDRMVDGFIEGATAANAAHNLNVSISPVQYVGSYGDNDTAFDMAYDMFNEQHISLIFAPVRASIHGVIQAANSTFNDQNTFFGFWQVRPIVIAAEFDLDWYGCVNPDIPTAPSLVGTSVLAGSDQAVYDIIFATFWDDFDGGNHTEYTLGHGVNLTIFEFSNTYLDTYTMDLFVEYYTGIVNGTYVVTPP